MANVHQRKPASALFEHHDPHAMGAMELGGGHVFKVIDSALDSLALVLSLWALAYYFEGSVQPHYLILSIIVFSLNFPGASRLGLSLEKLIFNIFFHWAWIAGFLLLTGFAIGYIDKFSRSVMVNWLWLAPLTQIVMHVFFRIVVPGLLKLQGLPRSAVIVGMNHQGMSLAKNIAGYEYSNIRVLGFFDDRSEERRSRQGRHRLIGKIEELAGYVKKHRVQLIYLSLPMTSRPRILQILDDLKDTTASIYFVPDMFVTDLIQGRSDSVCGVTVISVCDTPFQGLNGTLKRISDVVFSVLILLLIFPIMLLIGLLVKMDSPGPAILKQRRHGLDGKQILIYQFRSKAVTGGDATIEEDDENDVRVTRLGRFLRKTSLDALPQFINVLQGRMSIVGPRLHAVDNYEMYRALIKGYMVRYKVKPGITGWAQVNDQCGEMDPLDKMQTCIDFDLNYLRDWSLQLDVLIMLKSILLVFKNGADHSESVAS